MSPHRHVIPVATPDASLDWFGSMRQGRTAAGIRDREGAARLAAIANLPRGWHFDEPRRYREDLILRASGPAGDEIEVSGGSTQDAWRAMAEQLAALGIGRLIARPRP